jgi:hypothetical protein
MKNFALPLTVPTGEATTLTTQEGTLPTVHLDQPVTKFLIS